MRDAELQVGEDAEVGWGDRHRLLRPVQPPGKCHFPGPPSGTPVVISAAKSRMLVRGLRLAVADRETGMAEEDQERLFDRFWQVSRQDKRGAGLGLAIVWGIVLRPMGSKIRVESREGEGSTFFFLPVPTRRNRRIS